MGVEQANYLIVESWHEDIVKAYYLAKDLFGILVSPIIDTGCNEVRSFYISSTGSKYGWPRYKNHEEKIREFINKCEELTVTIVEVGFGELGNEMEIH